MSSFSNFVFSLAGFTFEQSDLDIATVGCMTKLIDIFAKENLPLCISNIIAQL